MSDEIKLPWMQLPIGISGRLTQTQMEILHEDIYKYTRSAVMADRQKHMNEWKLAIDHGLTTMQSTADSYDSPAEALHALIDWHVAVATDPKVNGQQRGGPVVLATYHAVMDANEKYIQIDTRTNQLEIYEEREDAVKAAPDHLSVVPVSVTATSGPLYTTPQPVAPAQQYYYRASGCKASKPTAPDCICWHDKGTGPFPEHKEGDEAGGVLVSWRAKPSAPALGLRDEQAEFEEWAGDLGGFYVERDPMDDGVYTSNATQDAWDGWQERALLAQYGGKPCDT